MHVKKRYTKRDTLKERYTKRDKRDTLKGEIREIH